jgi:tetratricopeptide (TPR) repeat protein
VVIGLLFLATASLAWSRSPAYDQGNAAYERNDFKAAAANFRKATQDDPKDALSFWKLGLALRKTGDNAGALQAWDKARAIDPKLGFASSPDKFNDLYTKTAQKAGNAPSSAAKVTRDPIQDIIVPALQKSDVYIEPTMKDVADQAKLEALAKSYRPKVVKIAIMTNVPGDRDQFAEFLNTYLGLYQGLMIVATQSGAGAFTRAVDHDRIVSVVSASVPEFNKSYYDGVKYIADQTIGNHGPSPMTWILLIVVIGGIAAVIFSRSQSKKGVSFR